MKSSGFFVTGTDTGIGKTVISTVLAVGLGYRYWKPIQTGTVEDRDSDFVGQWIGTNQVWPEAYQFPEPVSPHLAAHWARVEISIATCLNNFNEINSSPVIVEGAGGVLVPINRQHLMIDLIKELQLPTVVVTSTRLGTINHTLLTIEALSRRKIQIAGIVTVGKENPETIEALQFYSQSFAPVRILGHVPFSDRFSREWFFQSFKNISGLIHDGRDS